MFIRIEDAKMDTCVVLLEIPVGFICPKIISFGISVAFLIGGGK
ncbi:MULTISPECIES: hypothetical protein [Clostridium]|nr:hypothetical protein [Clostridium kluyveri]UZQ49908.1 hypothetical protein OP486_18460 [Clostridium kluyveri]